MKTNDLDAAKDELSKIDSKAVNADMKKIIKDTQAELDKDQKKIAAHQKRIRIAYLFRSC